MSYHIQMYRRIAPLLLGVGILATGCATTGVERAERTTTTMQTVESDYRDVLAQVDASNASLQDLLRHDQSDLKKALATYNTDVVRMEATGVRLDKHTADMIAKRSDYFAEWQKQGDTYSNPLIRQLNEERRLQLRDVFAEIPVASIGVKGSLHTYLVDIREIQNYLSNDLTPTGVRAITPVANKAMTDGETLKTSVRQVLGSIDRARTAMAQ
jgi:hypothetical protein